MATFPATLPAPTYDGYTLDPVDPAIRTDMETGAGRSRRRTKARNDRVSVTWRLTDAQMATFRAWFDNDAEAAGGAAWFDVNLAIGTTGLVSKSAKFSGVWKASLAAGMLWDVTATLEIR